MSWSDLPYAARMGIVAGAFLLVVVLLWVLLIAPLGPELARLGRDIELAESQVADMRREISAVAPPTAAEQASWDATADELYRRLGPESELALLIEAMVRLSESQGVDLYLTTDTAVPVSAAGEDVEPSRAMRVLSDFDDAVFVPLSCRVYGDHEGIGRFVAGLSRLGWVIEIGGMTLERQFPDVAGSLRLRAYFRATSGQQTPAQPAGAGRLVPPTQEGASPGTTSSGGAGAGGGDGG